ncbi:MAG: hypothetical protein H6965_03025 [Chromatiaceae bacterium]|nr:hypothetical protein [Chromatiaceae bacterium]
MKYTVYWDDAGDERTGSPFAIEADSPREAFYRACAQILSYGGATAKLFIPSHIEWLENESGERHRPQQFLSEENAGLDLGSTNMAREAEIKTIQALGKANWYALEQTIVSPGKTYPKNSVELPECRQRAVAALAALREQGFDIRNM